MSTIHHACCCGEQSGPCADSCDFASSYAVNGIAGSYIFESEWDAFDCGQACSFRSFRIEVNWIQVGPLVVTRQAAPGGGAPCCYRGQGMLLVTGSVTITDTYRDGICPDYEQTSTFDFERDVPCAITVGCGGTAGCGFTVTNPPGWTHTLHICDFLVTCSHEAIEGDCDSCYWTVGPFALRCVGGTVSYVSNLVAPNNLNGTGCLGYYAGSQCSGYPFPDMIANRTTHGPFAIVADEECSPQDEYDPCTLPVTTLAFLSTRIDSDPLVSPWLAAADAASKSACGGVSTTVGPSEGCRYGLFQLGCTTMPWNYT